MQLSDGVDHCLMAGHHSLKCVVRHCACIVQLTYCVHETSMMAHTQLANAKARCHFSTPPGLWAPRHCARVKPDVHAQARLGWGLRIVRYPHFSCPTQRRRATHTSHTPRAAPASATGAAVARAAAPPLHPAPPPHPPPLYLRLSLPPPPPSPTTSPRPRLRRLRVRRLVTWAACERNAVAVVVTWRRREFDVRPMRGKMQT